MFNPLRTIAAASAITAFATGTSLAGSSTPGLSQHKVAPGGEVVFLETFFGGELARIELLGDGHSDIDLWVFDAAGNEIARSNSYNADEAVEFVPAWTGAFEIVVVNYGVSNSSHFQIWTN